MYRYSLSRARREKSAQTLPRALHEEPPPSEQRKDVRSFDGERVVAIGIRRPLPRVRIRLVDLAGRCCRIDKSRPSSVRGHSPRSRRIGAPSTPRVVRGSLRVPRCGQPAHMGRTSCWVRSRRQRTGGEL
jgi:hypothetical protein